MWPQNKPKQQGNSPSSPGGLMPPAAKAGCCKSDHLSSYKGPQVSATGANRLPNPGPTFQLKAARQSRQQSNSPSSPGGHMPPAAGADAANLTTYLRIRGHRYLPSGGTGCQLSVPEQAQAARQQPEQPWGTHASSSQGRMLQI